MSAYNGITLAENARLAARIKANAPWPRGAKRQNPPRDPDNMNPARARWAQRAVDAFTHITKTDNADALADLLADLLHLCDSRNGEEGWDFDKALVRARDHYRAEIGRGE